MPTKRTPRLGKGLGALIKPTSTPAAAPAKDVAAEPQGGIERIAVDLIRPNRHQPRQHFDEAALQQLAESIKTSDILQPIIVRPKRDGNHELIAGERRLRAAKLAGLKSVPAIIRDVSNAEAIELALIENLQREDLNPLERATAYQEYLDAFSAGPEKLAARLGESRTSIVNYLRLLSLPAEVHEMMRSGALGMGQARAIAGLTDESRQLALARMTVRRNLAVRQVEELAKQPQEAPKRTPQENAGLSRHLLELERDWSAALGMKVRFKSGKKKNSGRIEIRYNNIDEYERIAEKLGITDDVG